MVWSNKRRLSEGGTWIIALKGLVFNLTVSYEDISCSVRYSLNKYLPSISDLPGSVVGEDLLQQYENSMYPHAVYVVTGKTMN